MKRCINSECIQTVWGRDIIAVINIFNLFLELRHAANLKGEGEREEACTRKRGCDEKKSEYGLEVTAC